MDAKSILAHFAVPNEMQIDYAGSFNSEPSNIFLCTSLANELWKLVAVLHAIERAQLSVDEIEFSTHLEGLSGVTQDLESLYEFLTGRSIRIIVRYVTSQPRQDRLSKPELSQPMILFSGGLDSLAAALSMSKQRPSLLFHAATSNIVLAKARNLRDSHPALVRNPIVYGDCRFSSLGGGFSQTRGLLFLSAAANVASNVGIRQIIVGENGPLMINPSVSPFSIPTKNSHPRLIADFQKIIQGLGYSELYLLALHKDKTKTEVIFNVLEACREGANDRLLRMLTKSYSCWRTQALTAMCGLCFACLVRKLSLLAAKIDEPDSVYEVDPFAVDMLSLSPADQSAMNDLKDSLAYYKRFATESDVPRDWNIEVPSSFFEDAAGMLRRFALDLFLGARNYFRMRRRAPPNALGRYCLDACREIGLSKLDSRESELEKKITAHREQTTLA